MHASGRKPRRYYSIGNEAAAAGAAAGAAGAAAGTTAVTAMTVVVTVLVVTTATALATFGLSLTGFLRQAGNAREIVRVKTDVTGLDTTTQMLACLIAGLSEELNITQQNVTALGFGLPVIESEDFILFDSTFGLNGGAGIAARLYRMGQVAVFSVAALPLQAGAGGGLFDFSFPSPKWNAKTVGGSTSHRVDFQLNWAGLPTTGTLTFTGPIIVMGFVDPGTGSFLSSIPGSVFVSWPAFSFAYELENP